MKKMKKSSHLQHTKCCMVHIFHLFKNTKMPKKSLIAKRRMENPYLTKKWVEFFKILPRNFQFWVWFLPILPPRFAILPPLICDYA